MEEVIPEAAVRAVIDKGVEEMKSYGIRIRKQEREIESALPARPQNEKPVITFNGRNIYSRPDRLYFTEKTLDLNTLFLGKMGCGKTNCLSEALFQLIEKNEGQQPIVILDIKGDYSELLEKHNIPATYFGINDYHHSWNQFEDFMAWDGTLESAELRAEEFAQTLFLSQRSQINPYFADAAAILFACLLKSMLRNASETGDMRWLNNAALKERLLTMQYEDWVSMLQEYQDFAYALSILNGGSGGSNDSNGVLSEIAIITGKIYSEAFAQKGSFSPVKFVKSGKGILVLRSDTSLEQKTLPVFSAVLDLMFRTLGSRNTRIRGADFILDEFGRLPNVRSMETALSLLRGKNVRMIAGIQITPQMEKQKTENMSMSGLLDLFTNIVYMGGGGESLGYFQKRVGDRCTVRDVINPDGSVQSRSEYRPAVEAEDAMKLKTGDAYITVSGSDKVFYFHFDKYSH